MTSLSALTLEVYYRYLPLYKLDTGSALRQAMKASTPGNAVKPEQTMAAAAQPNTAQPASGAPADSSATSPAGQTKPKSQSK